MKKKILFMLLIVLFLTACKTKNETQITTYNNSSSKVIKWFDYFYLNEDVEEMPKSLEIELDEFDGVTFVWNGGELSAKKGNETKKLFGGMPIWNTFFEDLNNDGYLEICSTISFGSGMIDQKVIVFDYHNDEEYILQDRGNYDYSLIFKEDILFVEKREYRKEKVIDSGKLFLEGENISYN